MMAVVLIVFGFVLGNMFGQKDNAPSRTSANQPANRQSPAHRRRRTKTAAPAGCRRDAQTRPAQILLLRRTPAPQRRSTQRKQRQTGACRQNRKNRQQGGEKTAQPGSQGRELPHPGRRLQRQSASRTNAEKRNAERPAGRDHLRRKTKHYLVLIGPYASKDQAADIQKKLETTT